MSYVDLLDYGEEGQSANFQCTTCGPQPDIVIFDGITLSFQRRYLTKTAKDQLSLTRLQGSRLVVY